MKYKFLIILAVAFFVQNAKAQRLEDTVLRRYSYYLSHTLQRPPLGPILQKLDASGKWNDIDYNGRLADNWQPSIHLKRIRYMALAWASASDAYYGNKQLLKSIKSAIDFWIANPLKSENWWYNEIGIPQYMRDIIVLMRPALNADQLRKCLKVMAQLHVGNAGANLIWSADLGLHYGALTADTAMMRHCRQLVVNEIKITKGEGIQPDFSFHQHGPRMQMYHYGGAFLTDNIQLAWELRGTSLAYPEQKINILIHFLLDGWQWMTRGINTVPGTIDRAVSRNDALHSSDIRALLPFLSSLKPEKANAFKAIGVSQHGGKNQLNGFRYFPYSDFATFQQKDFSFFLKTLSSRTLATESINQENKKGALLSSGDAYLIANGHEYFNMMPVWDWGHLPGVTAFEGAKSVNKQAFVGSVSDGFDGLSVMDYKLQGDAGQHLSAHKVWACHGQEVICLIAGIGTAKIEKTTFTTLDQSRLQGPITVDRPGNQVGEGFFHLKNVHWIHHSNFLYIPLKPASIDLTSGVVKGTWHSITDAGSAAVITDSVFMPVLLHDSVVNGGYVIKACKNPKEAPAIYQRPDWEILRNDTLCQAILFKDATIQIAFFAPDSLRLNDKQILRSSRACLIMIKDQEVFVSDPAHIGGRCQIQWDNRKWKVDLAPDGTTSKAIEVRQ
ncbi:MAG TPA: polysaccharide lyase family 8 super-sandwich domain-containing protein [Arachidicoccus sp.]|nr:polysaccharide lyase family 8 super-sandwich domain-containing protein [Arachidicoccus sp.]